MASGRSYPAECRMLHTICVTGKLLRWRNSRSNILSKLRTGEVGGARYNELYSDKVFAQMRERSHQSDLYVRNKLCTKLRTKEHQSVLS